MGVYEMESLYHRIRRSQEAGLPSNDLAPLVKELEDATDQTAPTQIAQKRAFLANWADDQQGKYSEPPPLEQPPVRRTPQPVETSGGGGDERSGSPPKGKSKLLNSPPPGPPPPMQPPMADATDVPPMDREQLMRTLHGYEGRQIPSSLLGSLATAIQTTNPEGPKAPSTVQQKRTFVDDWWKGTTPEFSESCENKLLEGL